MYAKQWRLFADILNNVGESWQVNARGTKHIADPAGGVSIDIG